MPVQPGDYSVCPFNAPRALLRDWWNQVCWSSGANSITNREIVLGLTNKDGGAHVDGSGHPNYRKAKQQGQMFFGQQLSNIAKMGHLRRSLAINSRRSLLRILAKSQMRLKILKERKEYTSAI